MAVNLSKEPFKKLPEYTPVHLMTEEESMQSHSLPEITHAYSVDEIAPVQPLRPELTITADMKAAPYRIANTKSRKTRVNAMDIVALALMVLATIALAVFLGILMYNIVELLNAGSVISEIDSLFQICKKGVLLAIVFAAVGFAIASIRKLMR